MSLAAKLADLVVGWLIKAICTIHAEEIKNIPEKGPILFVMNHINFLEVPIIHLVLRPRETVGMVKKETWSNILLGILGNLWKAIPLNRNGADLVAFRKAVKVLSSGGFLIVAPEGTRSGDGKLLKGQAGTVLLALQGKAPILPIAHFGGEKFWENFKKIRKTRMHFKVGKPFFLVKGEKKVSAGVREEMIGEIMYQIANCLPKQYRGHYSDMSKATTRYLKFL